MHTFDESIAVYHSLQTLLDPYSFRQIWNPQEQWIREDLFFDTQKSFMHLCMNQLSIEDDDVRNARATLVNVLSSKNKEKPLLHAWLPGTLTSAWNCLFIGKWNPETLIKNVDYINNVMTSTEDWYRQYPIVQYVVPYLNKQQQEQIWDELSDNISIPLNILSDILKASPTKDYTDLVQRYVKHLVKNTHIEDFLNELRTTEYIHLHPIVLQALKERMPTQKLWSFVESHSLEQRTSKVWDAIDWSVINKHGLESELHRYYDHAWMTNCMPPSEYDKRAVDFWTLSDSLVLFPNITKYCMEFYQRQGYHAPAPLDFSSVIHGYTNGKNNDSWLHTYKQYTESIHSIKYRDTYIQKMSDEHILLWIHLLLDCRKNPKAQEEYLRLFGL